MSRAAPTDRPGGGRRRRAGHYVIDESCIGCGACEHACPGTVDAVFPVPGDFLGRFAITLDSCIDCGFCVPLCPVDCIHDARSAPEGPERDAVLALQSWAAAPVPAPADPAADRWEALRRRRT